MQNNLEDIRKLFFVSRFLLELNIFGNISTRIETPSTRLSNKHGCGNAVTFWALINYLHLLQNNLILKNIYIC